jgi:hypothetical protein
LQQKNAGSGALHPPPETGIVSNNWHAALSPASQPVYMARSRAQFMKISDFWPEQT